MSSALRQEISERGVDSWPSVISNVIFDARISSANAQCVMSAEAKVTLYPAVFQDQVNREESFEKEKELNIRPLTGTELRVYHHTKAYYERNYDDILRIDKAKE